MLIPASPPIAGARPRALDVCAGAGGLSLGMAPAGHYASVLGCGVIDARLETSGLLDRPSTVVCTSGQVSPARNHARRRPAARLSLEHLAALQGFPPGFVFHGATSGSRHRQVGNAVPPPLAEAVARAILAALGLDAGC